MPREDHRELMTFHRNVADAARHIHGGACPCCGTQMHNRKVRMGKRTPRDRRTVGHDFPTAYGGNPEVWVYICHGCNNDQGVKSFRSWAAALRYNDDPRAKAVSKLVTLVDDVCNSLRIPALVDGALRDAPGVDIGAPIVSRYYTLSATQRQVLQTMAVAGRFRPGSPPVLKAARKLVMFGYAASVMNKRDGPLFEITPLGMEKWSACRDG